MLHISKTKTNQYIVVMISAFNGKVLSSSEPLRSKRAALKNVAAQFEEVSAIDRVYQVDSEDGSFLNKILSDGTHRAYNSRKLEKPYSPK